MNYPGPRLQFVLPLICLFTSIAFAGDWPQILGPNRNGQAEGEKLPGRLPSRALWSARLGMGYAGPAVVGKQVVAFHRVENQERVEAFDAATGKSLWKADHPAHYRGGVNPDVGPRCVPTIEGGRVFAYGASGDMYAVDVASGKKLWARELFVDYDGDEGYFGAGSAPIVVGGKLLVNVGGKGAGMVALDPATGKTLWQATDEAASYAAPTKATIGGEERAIFVTRYNAIAVDPANGQTKLLLPFGKRGPTVNAATPLVIGDQLFLSASYGIGATLARMDANGAKTIWSNDDTLSSQYATAVERDGYLYGCHGREDAGLADFRCAELKTGKVQWAQEGFGVAHAILAGDKLLILKVDGELVLAEANPKAWRQLATLALPQTGKARALPRLSGGNLFLRTTVDRGGELVCLAVGE